MSVNTALIPLILDTALWPHAQGEMNMTALKSESTTTTDLVACSPRVSTLGHLVEGLVIGAIGRAIGANALHKDQSFEPGYGLADALNDAHQCSIPIRLGAAVSTQQRRAKGDIR